MILQRSTPVLPNDTIDTLRLRIMEDCEWPLMNEAVSLFCSGKLIVRGKRVEILPSDPEE